MTLTAAQVKTAVLIGKYGGCLPACESGTIITGTFNLICTGVGIRGGKGTPVSRRRTNVGAIEHFIYQVPVADNVLIVDGDSITNYIPAKYTFIKTLPKVDAPEKVETKTEPRLFKHDSGVIGYEISGKTEVTTFDFTNFIILQDNELLEIDLLSTTHLSFVPIEAFNTIHINRLYADDLELLNIIETL